MGKCSFGKVVINGVFEARYPFGKDLEGRFIYLRDGSQQWLLAVFDFSGTFRRTCLKWREAVSEATGIPSANIWYHELQIHAAPISDELDGTACDRLVEVCVPVIRDMMVSAVDAELSYSLLDLENRFNVNREQYIPELGAVTVWAGLQYDSEGRPYSSNPDIMNLYGYKPDIQAFKDNIYFDRNADPQGALLVFRSKAGKILGTITRFAAHPDVAVLFESMGITDQYKYHSDWPGYLREAMDKSVGGTGLYVNGPCGNLSVRKGYEGMTTYAACDREALRIGNEIARAFLEVWNSTPGVWEDIELTGIKAGKADLPMRDSMPHSLEASKYRDEQIEASTENLDTALKNAAPPALIKKLIDEKMHQSSISTIINSWVGITDSELKSRSVGVNIEAVSLNGLIFAGLPGECLTETCQWLKAQSIGNKLIVLDQVNGYIGYMTTAEAYDQGGYSYWGSWLRRDAEKILRKKMLELIGQI
ncbi:MAG: hypothetical protein K0R50_1933 [Eubacterium sp.]|nr:hypothetical protein [Eubacterium sp.]